MRISLLPVSALLVFSAYSQAAELGGGREVKPVPPLAVSNMAHLGAKMWDAPEFNEFFTAGPQNSYAAFSALSHAYRNPGEYLVEAKHDGIVMTPASVRSAGLAHQARAFAPRDGAEQEAAEKMREKLYRYLENLPRVDSERVGQSLSAYFDQAAQYQGDVAAHAAAFPHEEFERLLPPAQVEKLEPVAALAAKTGRYTKDEVKSAEEFVKDNVPPAERLQFFKRYFLRLMGTMVATNLFLYFMPISAPGPIGFFIGVGVGVLALKLIFDPLNDRDTLRMATKHGWSRESQNPAASKGAAGPKNWEEILRWSDVDRRWARLNEAFESAARGGLRAADKIRFLGYLRPSRNVPSEWAPFLRENHVGALLGFLTPDDAAVAAAVAAVLKGMAPYWIGEYLAAHPEDAARIGMLRAQDIALADSLLAEGQSAKARLDAHTARR
jgi:hypothetical protein